MFVYSRSAPGCQQKQQQKKANKIMNESEIYDYIIEMEIATEQELDLIININGRNKTALNDVLFCRTGYRDIEQMEE